MYKLLGVRLAIRDAGSTFGTTEFWTTQWIPSSKPISLHSHNMNNYYCWLSAFPLREKTVKLK